MKSVEQLGADWNKRNSGLDLPPWFPGPMQEQASARLCCAVDSTAIISVLIVIRNNSHLSPAAWTKLRAPGIVAIAELGACSSALASSAAGGAEAHPNLTRSWRKVILAAASHMLCGASPGQVRARWEDDDSRLGGRQASMQGGYLAELDLLLLLF